jgi:hypothetical protein
METTMYRKNRYRNVHKLKLLYAYDKFSILKQAWLQNKIEKRVQNVIMPTRLILPDYK